MQLIIASGLLVALGAYLLHQFWSRSLAPRDDAAISPPAEQAPAPADAPGRLMAA
ncbi:MAG: hypothetical protein HY873_08595 [Chloroflexi bacterium]|nr:hypothetical protein [Chloroflexota bacterium]